MTLAFIVVTKDVADALAIARGAFRGAARDDPAGWEVTAAAAEVQPAPTLTGASTSSLATGERSAPITVIIDSWQLLHVTRTCPIPRPRLAATRAGPQMHGVQLTCALPGYSW